MDGSVGGGRCWTAGAVALLTVLATTGGACNSEERDPIRLVDGTVERLAIDGGCWTIRATDGTRYETTSLAEEFRKEGLEVHARLRIRDDLVSVCQVGPIADVLEIEPRTPAPESPGGTG